MLDEMSFDIRSYETRLGNYNFMPLV